MEDDYNKVNENYTKDIFKYYQLINDFNSYGYRIGIISSSGQGFHFVLKKNLTPINTVINDQI